MKSDLVAGIMSAVSSTEDKRIEFAKPVRLFDLTYDSWLNVIAIYTDGDILLVDGAIEYHYAIGDEKCDDEIGLAELEFEQILNIAKAIVG